MGWRWQPARWGGWVDAVAEDAGGDVLEQAHEVAAVADDGEFEVAPERVGGEDAEVAADILEHAPDRAVADLGGDFLGGGEAGEQGFVVGAGSWGGGLGRAGFAAGFGGGGSAVGVGASSCLAMRVRRRLSAMAISRARAMRAVMRPRLVVPKRWAMVGVGRMGWWRGFRPGCWRR